jgi:hypothetical protein
VKRTLALLIIAASSASALSSSASAASHAASPCAEGEAWRLSSSIPPRAREGLEYTAEGNLGLAEAFAQSEALAQSSASLGSPEVRAFTRYWQARAYYGAGLLALAHAKFSDLASQAPVGETAGFQAAALACLARIENEAPALSPRASVASSMAALAAHELSARERGWLSDYAYIVARDQVARGTAEASVSAIISLVSASPAHAAYVRGLLSARQATHARTLSAMDSFLKSDIPASLRPEISHAHLLMARAAYALGQFENAAAHYRKVAQSSNDFAQAMTELSWSFLLAERYPETIGATTNLEVGLLKTTFQPEAPMVLAMALNELCQFPASLNAVRKFQRDYQTAYFWLKSWKAKSSRAPLYGLAIASLTGAKGDAAASKVPARVATEWLRSPRFISDQGLISALFREEEKARKLSGSSSLAPGLRAQLAAFVAEAPALRKEATARINAELAARTQGMLSKLDEVAENSKLIQVEIYNGASHDMIWQSSNSDFQDKTSGWKAESQRGSAGRVWNWGRVRKSGNKTEIWEDELGNLQANLADNCSNKAKYLQLKAAK